MVGKWHVGNSQWRQTPTGDAGFESHTGNLIFGTDRNQHMRSWPWDEPFTDWGTYYENRTYRHYREIVHPTEAISREAITVMKKHDRASPLFLYVAFTAAHTPLEPNEEWMTNCHHIKHRLRRNFCGVMAGLDKEIDNLITSAEQLLGKDTIVIFQSDNGASTWLGGLNTPYRSGKTTPFEGGVRVPSFLVDLSKNRFPSGSYDGLMHVSDWLPTIAKIANISQLPPSIHGLDQSAAIKSLSEKSPRENILLDAYSKDETVFEGEYSLAYMRGKYKLIEGLVRDPHTYKEPTSWLLNSTDTSFFSKFAQYLIETAAWIFSEGRSDMLQDIVVHVLMHSRYSKSLGHVSLLYDLSLDPLETNNIASQYPELVKELREEATKLLESRTVKRPLHHHMISEDFENSLFSNNMHLHPWIPDDADLYTHPVFHVRRLMRDRLFRPIGIFFGYFPNCSFQQMMFSLLCLVAVLFIFVISRYPKVVH